MKQFLSIIACVLVIISCSSDNDVLVSQNTATLTFSHNWDGTEVSNSDLNNIKFTNQKGTELSIERLRYLISNVTFTNSSGTATTVSGYKLIDLSSAESLSYQLSDKIKEGTYTVSFTFGFNNTDNTNGTYQDLNTASWNVPTMLGGGYHFMQMDGKYLDASSNQANYNYHVIRAVDRTDPMNLVFEDTFFTVTLSSVTIAKDTSIEVKMNIAEWFKNPNEWDLNVLNTVLMPNFDAQKMMAANGANVFSLGTVN